MVQLTCAEPAESGLQKVGKDEAVAFDNFAADDRDGRGEHGPVVDEGVEFAVLAAWVDMGGEVCLPVRAS